MSQQHKNDKNIAISPAIKERNEMLVLLSRRTIEINKMQRQIK